MLKTIEKIKSTWTKIVVSFSTVVAISILMVNFAQVIVRYLTSISFTITDDLTVHGMLWMMGLGLSVACFYHEHLVINVIDSLVSEKTLKKILFGIDILLIFFGIFLSVVGIMAGKINKGFVQSMLGIDEVWRYVPVMVGGFTMSVACILNVIEQILIWKEEKKEVKK